MSDNFFAKMSYETVDAVFVTSKFFTPGVDQTHLDGQDLEGKDKGFAFGTTVATFLPYTRLNMHR